MAVPPLDTGGVQLTVAVKAPPAAPEVTAPSAGSTGAPGVVAGVTVFDAADIAAPTTTRGVGLCAFNAWTRKLYAVPLVSPETIRFVALPATSSVRTTVAPVRTWIRYPVIGEPPFPPGVHDS